MKGLLHTSGQFQSAPLFRVYHELLIFCLLLLTGATALAHKPSDSYLSIQVKNGQVTGQWDLALRDLEYAIGLDANEDGAITWGELKKQQPSIAAYAANRLHFRNGDSTGTIRVISQMVDNHTDGAYTVLFFEVDGLSAPGNLEIDYRALFDLDPLHRGLLRLDSGSGVQQAVFGPANPAQQFNLLDPHPIREFFTFVSEGIWHIWVGFDHILFIVALLLPAVLWHRAGRWHAIESFLPAFFAVLKIVTAFTVAHSLTLSLATLGFVRLPSRWVESSIAASVVLAAANNLRPTVGERGWIVAFAFGLIHGFGFASVLADLNLNQGALALALVGFNLGVEIGQMAIVAVIFPTAFLLRRSTFYYRFTLQFGSSAIMLVATTWMVERLFNLKWIPF